MRSITLFTKVHDDGEREFTVTRNTDETPPMLVLSIRWSRGYGSLSLFPIRKAFPIPFFEVIVHLPFREYGGEE